MKKLSKSNIYSSSAEEIRELFGDYLQGSDECAVLAMSARTLGPAARNAIEKSLESFGYGAGACTYATLLPVDEGAEGGDIPLDPQALMLLVEGLDPLCVICADEATAEELGHAYRTAFQLDAAERLFGRPAVVFRDLEALLGSDAGKQRAWRLFKSLPKR